MNRRKKPAEKIRQVWQSPDLAIKIAKEYRLKVNDITLVGKSWRVDTDQGPLYLKQMKQSEAELLFICGARQHLFDKGFTHMIPLVTTSGGEPYFKHKESWIMLMPWVDGRQGNEAYPRDLTAAAQILAELHTAARGFNPPVGSRWRVEWGNWLANWLVRCSELQVFKRMAAARGEKTLFDKLFLQEVDYYYAQGRKAWTLLLEAGYFTVAGEEAAAKVFCHGAYGVGQLLVGEKDIYIVSFDQCAFDLQTRDLGELIRSSLEKNAYALEQATAILADYEAVRPLQPGEYQLLLAMFTFPEKFYQLAYWYYVDQEGKEEKWDKWDEEELATIFRAATQDQAAREAFLTKFTALAKAHEDLT